MHSQDLESALHYSLRHEVALQHSISAPALHALRRYIRALALVSRRFFSVLPYGGSLEAKTSKLAVVVVVCRVI